MAVTLDDFAREMAEELGEHYADPEIADLLQRWVGESVSEITASGRWFWQNGNEIIVTVDGLRVYTLQSEVSEVTAIWAQDFDKAVAYLPVERLIHRGENLVERGALPRVWYYAGMDATSTAMKIAFWPVPDATTGSMNIQYLKRPAIGSLTDLLPIPDDYLDVVRLGVRALSAQNADNIEGYGAARQLFTQRLQVLSARFDPQVLGTSRLRVKQSTRVHQGRAAADT